MISCAFKIHRASGPGRGKPGVLAFLPVFHTVTPEHSSFRENPTYFRPLSDAEYVVSFVERLMAREVRCRGTD